MRRSSSEPPQSERNGFALAAVLLIMLGLSGLAAAGYLVSNTDYRINQNHRASVKAFYVADAGLEHYLGRGKMVGDTVQYNHADGMASVWASPLIEVDDSASLFLVHSLGEHRPPEGGMARRQVASVVLHKAVGFNATAAITAGAGLRKNGTSGKVSGFDASTAADCRVGGRADVAGLVVPEDGFDMAGGGKSKKGGGGAPPGFEGEPPILDEGTSFEILAATGVPWNRVLAGSFAEADFIVSEDGYPDFGSDIDADQWPVIYADSDDFSVNPTNSGRGALIVQGDLEVNGSFSWEGIILVGGQLTSNGNNHLEGSVIAGLNILVGKSASEVDVGNGNWEYRYNACNVMNALKGLGWPVEEPGTWFEVM